MLKEVKAVVLAAGMGSRLEPFTKYKAKPMMTVVNRPVMEHILRQLHQFGVKEIFCNLHYRPKDMMDYFGDGVAWGTSILWRIEDTLTGPAGGVATFSDVLKDEDPILVISGDALHDVDLQAFVDFHKERNALLSVVMKRITNHGGKYGVGVIQDDGRITQFREKPPLEKITDALVSCGLYCLSQSCLQRIPHKTVCDFGANLIPEFSLTKEAVFGFETESYWKDIGDSVALRLANLDALTGRVKIDIPGKQFPEKEGVYVEEGAIISDTVKIIPPALIGKNAQIKAGATIMGPTVIGSSVLVSEGAYISNSVLLQGTYLPREAIMVDGIIGTASTYAEKL